MSEDLQTDELRERLQLFQLQSPSEPRRLFVSGEACDFLRRLDDCANVFESTPPSGFSILELFPDNTSSVGFRRGWREASAVMAERMLTISPLEGTATVILETPKQARFSEMISRLGDLVSAATAAIPGIRELSVEERNNFRNYYKKTYKKL